MSGRRVLDLHTAYEQKAKASVLSPGANQQILLHDLILHNRSGGNANLGALIKLNSLGYLFGLLQSGNPVVDVTTLIQAGTVQDIITTTANDGFLVQSERKFNLIGLAVSQAQTGTPVYAFEYYNGTSYVALPDIIETPDFSTTGDKTLVFSAPRDWALGSTLAVGGSSTRYSIRVIATTAPTQAVQANDVWIGKLLHYQAQVPHNGNMTLGYHHKIPRVLDSLEGIMPYFSVASASNLVSAQYESVQ